MKIETKTVSIDKIRPDPNQPRKGKWDKKKLDGLVKNIKSGQNVIHDIEIDEKNMIITGELRWRAAKMAGLNELNVKVIKNITPFERKLRQFSENFHRQGISASQEADTIKKLWEDWQKNLALRNEKIEENLTKFSDLLGISNSTFRNIIKITEAPDPIRKAVKEGKISPTVAVELMKVPSEKSQEKLLNKVIKGEISERELRVEVDKKAKTYKQIEQELGDSPEIKQRAIEELEMVDEEVDKAKEDIKKQKEEAVKDIIDEGKRMKSGEKRERTVISNRIKTFIKKLGKIRDDVIWRFDVERILNLPIAFKNEVVDNLRIIRDTANDRLEKLGER